MVSKQEVEKKIFSLYQDVPEGFIDDVINLVEKDESILKEENPTKFSEGLLRTYEKMNSGEYVDDTNFMQRNAVWYLGLPTVGFYATMSVLNGNPLALAVSAGSAGLFWTLNRLYRKSVNDSVKVDLSEQTLETLAKHSDYSIN